MSFSQNYLDHGAFHQSPNQNPYETVGQDGLYHQNNPNMQPTTAHSHVGADPLVPTWVMSPTLSGGGLVPTTTSTTSSSLFRGGLLQDPRLQHVSPGTWTIRTCRVCADIMSGPSVACESCQHAVHGHCAVRRHGHLVCRVCADTFDYQLAQHQTQHMMALSGLRLGRFVQGAGSITGHAIGAVATSTAAGAARLVAGVAGGAQSALQAARTLEFAGSPPRRDAHSVESSPVRPRALEEYDVSEAGSQEVASSTGKPEYRELLAQMRNMQKQVTELQQESAKIKLAAASS